MVNIRDVNRVEPHQQRQWANGARPPPTTRTTMEEKDANKIYKICKFNTAWRSQLFRARDGDVGGGRIASADIEKCATRRHYRLRSELRKIGEEEEETGPKMETGLISRRIMEGGSTNQHASHNPIGPLWRITRLCIKKDSALWHRLPIPSAYWFWYLYQFCLFSSLLLSSSFLDSMLSSVVSRRKFIGISGISWTMFHAQLPEALWRGIVSDRLLFIISLIWCLLWSSWAE